LHNSQYMRAGGVLYYELRGGRFPKKRKLFNGFIRTDYYQYFGKRPPRNS
ncbi:class I SAM-dependent RNA methyltransferase, partial [Bacillus sp. D-CC]